MTPICSIARNLVSLDRRPLRLLLLAGVFLLANGCAMAPGLYIEDTNLPEADQTESRQIDVVTITPDLVARQDRLRTIGHQLRDEQLTKLVEESAGPVFPYKVGVGDVLGFYVWGQPELSTLGKRDQQNFGVRVDSDGTISFPFVERVQAAGLTLPELNERLTRTLGRFLQNPQIETRIIEFNSTHFHVTGAVVNPGKYAVTDKAQNLLEIPKLVGANESRADFRKVTFQREGTTRVVDLRALSQRQDSTAIWMRDGDLVYFPPRDDRIFVAGEVRSQKLQYRAAHDYTLADAIGTASGLSLRTADAKRVYVIRSREESGTDVFQLNANSPQGLVLATQFQLEPQDIVYVAAAPITKWNRFISLLLPTFQLTQNAVRTIDLADEINSQNQ